MQANPLPLKNVINDPSRSDSNNLSADDFQRLSPFYYPLRMSANEANVYGRHSLKSAELMELSASNYYAPSGETYPDYLAVTTLPSAEDFEFEKINPSDIKKINKNATLTGVGASSDDAAESLTENRPNITQQQLNSNVNLEEEINHEKYSKLLFSSPSATVTSNGPSGPFKAIICHDCENSEGRNVGHSVSFSAIKSWNVGRSKVERVIQNQTAAAPATYSEGDNVARVKAPDKYYENQQNARDENHQIEMNDKVELFKVENLASVTEKPIVPTNTWNYSHLPIHINHNNNNPTVQRKPIFNDLLKVPYDILNAPLTETSSPEPVKSTQIHINHQQKFNDTITSNYQHFQQFIQKNLKPNMMQHYQSTPMPEQNYEVDESVSLMTNGRAHGVQSTTARANSHVDDAIANLPPSAPNEQEQDAKFGYVVEGRNFRKYRVEEKTADGFIVG